MTVKSPKLLKLISSMEKAGDTQTQRKRILFFPLPLQGHINPMLQLANILHSKGFSITVIHTTFNSPDASHFPHFTFHSISEGLSAAEASTKDVIALLSLLNVKCVAPFQECLARILSDDSEEPVACLISDAVLHFTSAVAKSFQLPRLVLRTGGVSSFLAFAAFPVLQQKGYLLDQDSRLEELVPELPPLRVKDLPLIKTNNPETLYQLVEGMVKETKASSGLIWNSFEELEKPALATLMQDFPIRIFPVGPFHKYFPACSSSLIPHDQTCISWYVTHVWAVGLQLENGLERAQIKRDIKRVMVEKEGKEMKERAEHLKEKVNKCLQQGGSSNKSLESLLLAGMWQRIEV
ncbi:UDP-glycosyltransferase 76B1 [Heracleum sosnowskyi]|uniref:UDP-glycosyltransferase 76B1 n=1 Tax=Heracleum sosnowskyi TaxID=360622 RepID=A0AAD8HCA2_9APIA|nr:UDP-glycosyltransferase 76B1 [Heracleum sosnowskyi]